jgi:hypothetical protein
MILPCRLLLKEKFRERRMWQARKFDDIRQILLVENSPLQCQTFNFRQGDENFEFKAEAKDGW